MGNISNEDKRCQSGDYTDLSSTYRIKMICLPAVAVATAFQSTGETVKNLVSMKFRLS